MASEAPTLLSFAQGGSRPLLQLLDWPWGRGGRIPDLGSRTRSPSTLGGAVQPLPAAKTLFAGLFSQIAPSKRLLTGNLSSNQPSLQEELRRSIRQDLQEAEWPPPRLHTSPIVTSNASDLRLQHSSQAGVQPPYAGTRAHRPVSQDRPPPPPALAPGQGGTEVTAGGSALRAGMPVGAGSPPAGLRGYLQAPLVVGILIVPLLFPFGFFLLLVLEFLLLLLVRGVVAPLTLRLLFQILFIVRQLVMAPLQGKGDREAPGPRGGRPPRGQPPGSQPCLPDR